MKKLPSKRKLMLNTETIRHSKELPRLDLRHAAGGQNDAPDSDTGFCTVSPNSFG
jgi:hypothetical protein